MLPWMNVLAELNQTPSYIFDVEKLLQRLCCVKNGLNGYIGRKCYLCYAMKANPFLIASVEKNVDKFEVCSEGELSICIDQKINMEKVVFSGVVKGLREIHRALDAGVGIFTVESEQQLKLLRSCAREYDRKIPVLLRVTSGNQFGMDWSVVKQIICDGESMSELEIKGIQYFSGTQKKIERIVSEIELLCDYDRQLQEAGCQIEVLEYGPGLGVDYFGNEKENLDNLLYLFGNALNKIRSDIQIVLEMGRFLVADCGWYVTRVMDIKRNDEQNYCLVDGGIHHVNYFGQVMGARKPSVRHYRRSEKTLTEINKAIESGIWNLSGSLCTVADVLVRNFEMESPQLDDYIVFEKTGAYSVTEGMYLFLSHDLPKIFFWQDGRLKLARDSYGTYQWNCSQ